MSDDTPTGVDRDAALAHLDEAYDFALTVTWDPETAADATLAAVNLLGAGAGDRLRLLGAVRREALAVARPPERLRVDPAAAPSPADLGPDDIETIALSAVSGLDPGDRAVLDLALRRHLDPEELGVVLGAPAHEAESEANAAATRTDRLIGHYVLARLGTRDCTVLAAAVDEAPPGLGPLAERVDRHLPTCQACSERRAGVPPATSLFAAIPERPAPESVRDTIGAEERRRGERRRWPRVVVAVIGVALVATGVVAALQVLGDDDPAPPAPPLEPSATGVEFGPTATNRTVTLSNTGAETVPWKAELDVDWLTPDPARGSIPAGEKVEVTLRLDRSASPEGRVVTTVRFVADGVTIPVDVAANVTTPPEITSVAADPEQISATPCEDGATTSVVRADIEDESGLASAVVRSTGPDGTEAEVEMTGGPDRFRARLGPYETDGEVTFTVVATDTGGNTVTSDPMTVTVLAECVALDEDA
jgi:hypothetical protein